MDDAACRRDLRARHLGRQGRGTDHFLGRVGSGQLSPGTGQRLHRRDRHHRHRADDAVAGLPDQGLRRVQRPWRRLRHGGRRLAVARRRLDPGPLCRPDRLLQQAQAERRHGPGHRRVLRRVPEGQQEVLGGPARGRRHRLGLSQGLVRRPQGKGSLQGEVRLRPRHPEDLQGAARHRRVLLSSRREEVRHRHLHRQLL